MSIRALATSVCVFAALATPAFAQLTDLDTATRDEATGLDWLDVTATAGLSFDQVEAGIGGWTDRNWRHATATETCALMSSYALAPASPCGTGLASQSGDHVRALQSLLGLTRITPGQQEDTFGFLDNGTPGPAVGLGSLIYSIPGDLSIAGVELTSIFDRTTSLPTHGHFLVRNNAAPVAEAGADQAGTAFVPVMLDGSAVDPDGDPIVSYLWSIQSQPPASNPVLSDPTSPTAEFTADTNGDYVLSLVAGDGFDQGAPDTVTIQIGVNAPPVAIVTADVTSGPAPLVVTFDGSASFDPESGPLGYAWDFDDGSQAFFSPIVVHEFTAPGTYNVRLRVNDDVGQIDDAFVLITVEGEPVPVSGPGALTGLVALLALMGSRRLRRASGSAG